MTRNSKIELRHKQDLNRERKRRLAALEMQQARKGIDTPRMC